MNWDQIVKFCFTWAIPGGAWLEDRAGERAWHGFDTIQKHFGQPWIDRQMQKTGWMTGCWIEVDPQPPGVKPPFKPPSWFTPMGQSILHPTQRDSDGGASHTGEQT